MTFKGNFAFDTNINATSKENIGGIVGTISQVPSSVDIRLDRAIYNGTIKVNDTECTDCGLIGDITVKNTGSSTGYGSSELSLEDFYSKSNFMEYFKSRLSDEFYIKIR